MNLHGISEHTKNKYGCTLDQELTNALHLLEEQSCQILSRSDLKRRSLRFLKSSTSKSSNKNKNKNNKMSSDIRSVPDLKITPFPSHVAHTVALISLSLALSQTPVHTASLHCETTDRPTGLVHQLVCLFTPQLSMVLIAPTYCTYRGMARLS